MRLRGYLVYCDAYFIDSIITKPLVVLNTCLVCVCFGMTFWSNESDGSAVGRGVHSYSKLKARFSDHAQVKQSFHSSGVGVGLLADVSVIDKTLTCTSVGHHKPLHRRRRNSANQLLVWMHCICTFLRDKR